LREVVWSPLAELTYYDILLYVIENYGLRAADELDLLVCSTLDKLKVFDRLCPSSYKMPSLRKCTLSKQTSMIYSINKECIEVVEFLNNRSGHEY
jgi:hypothetical protein